MLAGTKDRGPGVFSYRPRSRVKRSGFSILELFIASLILSVILGGLFLALNLGNFSYSLSSKRLDIQAQVRLAMDWITKDVRESISWNIASTENAPSTIHLKFNLWAWNTTTNTWDLSADFVEYNYDSGLKKLMRAYYNDTTKETMFLEFNEITEAPFYTTYVAPGDPANILDADALRNDRRLIVVIRGQKQVRDDLYVPFNLISEVKVRNG